MNQLIIGMALGAMVTNGIWFFWPVHVKTETKIIEEKELISVLTEKKECEDEGGTFDMRDNWDMVGGFHRESRYEMECYLPSKPLWNKKFD